MIIRTRIGTMAICRRYLSDDATRKFLRVVQAARGNTKVPNQQLLPCFAIPAHDIQSLSSNNRVATPSDFHAHLCHKVQTAKRRVQIATLYIGTDSSSNSSDGSSTNKEAEFLKALQQCQCPKVTVIMDESRALRPISINKENTTATTNSAQTVHNIISSEGGVVQLVPIHTHNIPSPVNELLGVFHVKAYIIDDELILSGANLSQDYFTNRRDRYLSFVNGANGLVEFYANILSVIAEYGYTYHPNNKKSPPLTTKRNQDQLAASLSKLFTTVTTTTTKQVDKDVVHVIPAIQLPNKFSTTALKVPSHVQILQSMLQTAQCEYSNFLNIQLASAYFNPTNAFTSTVLQCPNVTLITAGLASHGFAPAPTSSTTSIKQLIPLVYMEYVKDIAIRMHNGQTMQLYDRIGWTFHAKGLWITTTHDHEDNNNKMTLNPDSILANVIGSGNFNCRSDGLDFESNCILLFPPESCNELQVQLMQDWKDLLHHSKVMKTKEPNPSPTLFSWACQVLKQMF